MASIREEKKQKKQKSKKNKSEKALTLKRIKTLGDELISSKAHLNNLPLILAALSPSSPLPVALEALISLQSFFVPLAAEIPSKSSAEPGQSKDPELVYKAWLRARFDEFVNTLIQIALDSQTELALKDVALDAIMEFVKLGKDGRFQSSIYHRLLHSIVHSASAVDPQIDLLAEKYFQYLDVRYFTYASLNKIAKDCDSRNTTDSKQANLLDSRELSESRKELSVQIIYDVLSRIPSLGSVDKEPNCEMWSSAGLLAKDGKASAKVLANDSKVKKTSVMQNEIVFSSHIPKKIKLKFTKAWLSFLRLPLPLDIYKKVLGTLDQTILPYMAKPAILCDFLTKSYDLGGVISVMSLRGLYILMTEHGLEYPKFYEKLYALLTPAVFMAKHRAKFFQLLDSCLKTSHLPAYVAAAFAKRLSRLALVVPPSGALVIIAIIHNLLRRHPAINFLVHKQSDDETEGDASVGSANPSEDAHISDACPVLPKEKRGVDPFKSEENDPAKSGAMKSSLWEIDTLRHHYCPAVSRSVASLENDLTVRAKTSEMNVEDVSYGSYASVFRNELHRRTKQKYPPLAFYRVIPNSLFLEQDFPGWSFGDPRNTQEAESIQNDDAVPVKRQRVEAA